MGSRRRGKTNKKRKSGRHEDSSDEEFVVEAILDEKPDNTVLVKWKGYDEATWEPVDAMPTSLIKRFRQSKSSIQVKMSDVGESDDDRSNAEKVEISGKPSSPRKLGSG